MLGFSLKSCKNGLFIVFGRYIGYELAYKFSLSIRPRSSLVTVELMSLGYSKE